jgi:hypothetical protein
MIQTMMPVDPSGLDADLKATKRFLKHIGSLKEDNAKVAIIFRTVPNEPENCLVMGPKFLDDTYHNAFMKTLESAEAQNSFELGTYLARSMFPDGVNMLAYLHEGNFIKKMPTKNITVSFGSNYNETIGLDELNKLIAKEKGITVEELAVDPDAKKAQTKNTTKTKTTDAKKKSTK